MLKELQAYRRHGEPRRKWYGDDDFDLIVWFDDGGDVWGFQLCYDVGRAERAVTWTVERGYTHHRVDDGEATPFQNLSPILVPDDPPRTETLARRFAQNAVSIDPVIRDFVVDKLRELQSA